MVTKTMVLVPIVAFGVAIAMPALATGASLSGKLWIIKANSTAAFPPPTVTPDVKFTTNQAAFAGQGPNAMNTTILKNFTVGTFLKSVAKPSHVAYSGMVNPVTGKVTSSGTLISDGVANESNGTYETLIEISGSVVLKNGEYLDVTHDDGAALEIDGTLISGINGGNGGRIDAPVFGGGGGQHTFDLLYIAYGGPDELLFGPAP